MHLFIPEISNLKGRKEEIVWKVVFTVALKFETRKPLDEKKPKQIKCLTSGNWGSEKGLSLTVCFTLLPFLMIEHQSNNGLKINILKSWLLISEMGLPNNSRFSVG